MIEKTKYRIDIYAEQDGTWSGVTQLLGGPQPFVTEENKSDDFFTPVRSQTGNIQVCTAIPAGGTLSLDDILPANNIDHPVRLVSIAANNAETIEWQGFLSCEAYSQSYTSISQILTLPVISVLEAMDSVQLDNTRSNGFVTINKATYNALNEIAVQSGLTCFTHINYSATDYRIFQKYINQMIFFGLKEQNTESGTNRVIDAKSAKEALSYLCTLMGWTAREQGTELYLERIGETLNMRRDTLANFNTSFNTNATNASIVAQNISGLEWRGADHKRNHKQGAKSVEVVAKLEKYEVEFALPAFPEENMTYDDTTYAESYMTDDITFSNMLSFAYFHYQNDRTHASYDTNADVESAYGDCALNSSCSISGQYPTYTNGQYYYCGKHIGAFFANVKMPGESDFTGGLYAVMANKMDATEIPPTIFTMRSILHYALADGWLEFKLDAQTMDGSAGYTAFSMGTAYIVLQFGNKYYNGTTWVSNRTIWVVNMLNVTSPNTFKIYFGSQLQGEIKIELLGALSGGTNLSGGLRPYYDLFIKEMSLTHHREEEDYTYADRSENHYITLLSTNFRDEVSINTDIATSLNNKLSPSLVMKNTSQAESTIDYTISGGTEPRKPEKDLLNRLAAYYGAARQTLELKVKHPTAAALPLLKLNGISPDTKKYLPLAESRDWIADVATLTCFETPE